MESPLSEANNQKLEGLLRQMTLEEKAGQTYQAMQAEAMPEFIRQARFGTMICATSAYAGSDRQDRMRAKELNRLQRIAVEESRLGIPLIFARDVIHGHRTVAPIALGQAASWSPKLVREAARIAALEARADGLHWTFSPMLDVARDPRWGRIAEGFGEDPFLAAVMARASISGFQGEDLSRPDSVMACAKHYVGYGAAEGGRDYNTVEISEYTLRNGYMPPFKAAVEVGVRSIMASFNEIGGLPVSANAQLLTQILRDEWGFKGVVVSDWNAIAELCAHGIAADLREAAGLAALAGVDVDMASHAYPKHIAALVEEGVVSECALDEMVRRVLRAKMELGLFDRPYTDESLAEKVHFMPESVSTVRELAAKSIVLLKNDGLLPLKNFEGVLGVFGPLSQAQEALFGTWTLDGLAEDVVSPLKAIRRKIPDERLRTAALTDQALFEARWCDAIVAIVGEAPIRSGEDSSVTTLDLPPGQTELIEGLARMGKPLVVVVVAGRPLSIGKVLEKANAVLWCFHPGVAGGLAIVDALMGEINPSGKLPVTFPRSVGQVPIHYNHKRTGRPVGPDSQRTRYIDELDTPLFPFGFGLSYTTFAYSNIEIRKGTGNVRHILAAEISNTGRAPGEEVVQLYIRDEISTMTRPVKELKGFQRVALEPGETKVVQFEIGDRQLGYYNRENQFVVEPGWFTLWIGPDCTSGLESRIEVPVV